MKKLIIAISEEAFDDAAKLAHYIKDELKSPFTADRYMKEIDDAIQKLSFHADSVGANEYVQSMFGINVRHIIVKKMAIIFFIERGVVYIQRIIAGTLIH
ncbi:MAG: type II toxin-antitoxin system RelE/ParE family toxin [Tannerella sp.]|jgi:hypothetical protein|nr:type II toxin-antitoxin system RelE/ParE family toxin [Tannerella sp.]